VLKPAGRPPGDPEAMKVWNVIGIVLAAVLAVGGLFVIGFIVLLFVGLNHWGQNK
jgi:hypothetical protein